MNHIHSMQAEIEKLTAERDALLAGARSIRDYVRGEKFASDPHVSTDDIVLRVDEVVSEALDIELIPYGAACNLTIASEISARQFAQVVYPGDGRWGGE